MSEFIKNFRVENPQYNDMADDQLVSALHNKYYSDIPAEQFSQKIGYQSVPLEQITPAIQQPIVQQDQQIDAYTGAAMKVAPEKPMLDLIGEKLKNWGAGAGERFGDVGSALLKTIETTGRGLEQKAPMGGFVWGDDDIIPSYKSPEEWAERDAKPILLKGAKALEGIDLGYQEKVGWEDVKKSFSEGGALSGSAYADVLEYGIEQGVKSIPDMVAAVYALPTYIFARSGEIGEERAKNKGKARADIEDVLEAAPFAAASALLERIGAKGMTSGAKEELGKEMLKAGLKESAKRSAKAGGKALSKEAGTEAIQEGMLEYVGERYGTNAKMDFMEALDRAAAGAVAGGVMGGTIGTASSVVNEINYSPQKELAKALEAEIDATTIEGADQAAIDALKPERGQVVVDQQAKQEADIKTVPETKAETVLPTQLTADQPIPDQMPQQEPVAIDIPQHVADVVVDTESVPSKRADIEPVSEAQQDIISVEKPEQRLDQPVTKTEPMVDTKVKPDAALTPMPEKVHFGFSTYQPKPITGDLYREASVESLSDLLRETLSNNVERGSATPVFVADNKDIALGQGKNKGVMIEFDGNLVSGDIVKKPGMIEGVTSKEYKTDFVGRDAIKRFTLPKGVRLTGAGKVMARHHFDVKKNDNGSITYTRKDLAGQIGGVIDKPAAEKDTFTFGENTFVRGDYAKAVKSDSKGTFFDAGDIEGISQAKKQVKIGGTWHDFGSIVKADRAKEIKPKTKPLSEVVAKAGKEAEGGFTEADKVPEAKVDYSTDAIGSLNDFAKSIVDQTATAEDIKADAERVIASKDKIIKQFSERKVTKAMLQNIVQSPRTNLKKPQLVKLAYQQMLRAHSFGDGVASTFDGSESFEEQTINHIRNQTQGDVDNDYEKQRQLRAKEQEGSKTDGEAAEASAAAKRVRIHRFKGEELNDIESLLTFADLLPGHRVLNIYTGKGSIADNIRHTQNDTDIHVYGDDSAINQKASDKGYETPSKKNLSGYDRVIATFHEKGVDGLNMAVSALDMVRPGGKLIAMLDNSLLKTGQAAKDFKVWVDKSGHSIERAKSEGSFILTIDKNDNQTLDYKSQDSKITKPAKEGERIYNAPGHNFIGLFKSTGIPERREFVMIEDRKLKIPDKPQRIEPIMRKLTQIMGRRIYFGKIKGKSQEGFYRPGVGEVRTRRKNDVEVLAHEMAHYLDVYSNVTLPNFQNLYKDSRYVDEVMALSYTDATPDLQRIEGFAEFVRLWLTNAQEAQLRAPGFYDAFTSTLARDRKLLNPMRDMQDLMHKFFFQGPDKLGQALIGNDQSFLQTFDEWKYRRDSRIRQQTIDRFHAARIIEQELTRKISGANESAWKQFRIANGGAEGIADYVMNYGTVNFDESGDLKRTGESLHEVLQPLKTVDLNQEHKGDKKIDLLMRYFAGRRALELHRQKRENLIPKETAKEWARLGSTYPVFESIHKSYQAFNQRLMDFYVDAGMITADGRRTMESMNKDYVPFNRIRETLTDGKGAGSAGLQRLKGGTANLNDILVNIQDGIATNIRSALSNHAKQRLYQYISGHKDGAIFATRIAPDSRKVKVYQDEMVQKIGKVLEASGIEIDGEIDLSDPSLTDFWQHGVKPQLNESGNIVDTVIIDGKRKYYEVQDPLLQEMLIGMNPESYSSFMNVMFGAKNFFTRMITLGIEFTGANLVRDTIGATFISKNNFRPFIDSFKGMYSFIARDQHFQDFMRSGGGYSSRLHATTKEGVARRKVSVDEFGVTTGPERILSAIDNIASAFEYGTRIGEFRLAKKNNRSDLDAAFAAREISTDFSVLGANHFLTGYIRTVPFLNAMVQSQDRVFREAIVKRQYDGNPSGMAMKAFLGLTIPTLILYLINKDDDDYKQIPDYEKRTNWHVKVGDGQFIKIPRPYDVGFVYATMPEIFFKFLEDEKGKEFSDGMLWTLTQMYGIDGTPAMMTGWWDLVRNEKWTGAPVVPSSLSNVSATEQYTSNTSETFIRLGEATGMSPIKAEHMFKAYTGYLGGYLMWGTDHLLWDESKFGAKPDSKASDNVFLRRFLTPDVRPSSSAMEKFFDLKEKSDEIVSTFKQTIDVRRAIKGKLGKGKFKDDKFFGLSGKEKEVLFALNDSMNQLIKILYGKEGIKTAELSVKHDKQLTGKEKRQKLDNLWRVRNKAFMSYYTKANEALQKAKVESEKLNKGK